MTNETMVITSAGPADLIATVWFSLGYKPRNSLVLLGFEGSQLQVNVLLRADLPPPGWGGGPLGGLPTGLHRAVLREMVTDLLGTVTASGAHGVLAIVADDDALDRCPPVVAEVRRGARRSGLRLLDVLGVTSTAFASLLCRDPFCCPPGGQPIERVWSSQGAAVHVVNGDTVADSEDDLLADVTPGPADAAGPSAPFSAGTVAPEPGSGSLSVDQRWRWWERWKQACRRAELEPGRAQPLPGFSAALHDPHLRDAVLLSVLGAVGEEVRWMLDGRPLGSAGRAPSEGEPEREPERDAAPDGDAELEADAELERDAEPDPEPAERSDAAWDVAPDPEVLSRDFGRLLRRRPDVDRLGVGQSVLAGTARVAQEGDRGPALAVLAMLAWLEGRGSRSRLLLERAEADAPSVSLIRLVGDLLDRRIPPPWSGHGPKG